MSGVNAGTPYSGRRMLAPAPTVTVRRVSAGITTGRRWLRISSSSSWSQLAVENAESPSSLVVDVERSSEPVLPAGRVKPGRRTVTASSRSKMCA